MWAVGGQASVSPNQTLWISDWEWWRGWPRWDHLSKKSSGRRTCLAYSVFFVRFQRILQLITDTHVGSFQFSSIEFSSAQDDIYALGKKLDECVDVFGWNKESVDVFALNCVTAFYYYFISPWYNRNGWLGVKLEVTYLLTYLLHYYIVWGAKNADGFAPYKHWSKFKLLTCKK